MRPLVEFSHIIKFAIFYIASRETDIILATFGKEQLSSQSPWNYLGRGEVSFQEGMVSYEYILDVFFCRFLMISSRPRGKNTALAFGINVV